MGKESNPQRIIDQVYSPGYDPSGFANKIHPNPIYRHRYGVRPNSFAIEGGGFGDEGKGRAWHDLHGEMLAGEKKEAVSIRWQGGNNTGHEVQLSPDKIICHHQIPVGVDFPGTTGIITRGMVLNPEDAVTEIGQIEKAFGQIPGNLLIDTHTPLCLDTERAFEAIIGATGSTGMGIGPAYAGQLLRNHLTMEQLMDKDWQAAFANHYLWVQKTLIGHGQDLATLLVSSLADKKRPAGSLAEFIDRLATARDKLAKFVSPHVIDFIRERWHNPVVPFSAEGAQAIGLLRSAGLDPDYTASETTFYGIRDATEGVIKPQTIAGKFGVLKAYLSSVGKRILPGGPYQPEVATVVRNTFGEVGKSSGRPRDIYPVHIPALKFFRDFGEYDWLVVTHLDWTTEKVKVVVGYLDQSGQPAPYRPYQRELDKLTPVTVDLPGWDGQAAGRAKTPKDLPENALRYLNFLSRALQAPIAYATVGPNAGQTVSWLKKL